MTGLVRERSSSRPQRKSHTAGMALGILHPPWMSPVLHLHEALMHGPLLSRLVTLVGAGSSGRKFNTQDLGHLTFFEVRGSKESLIKLCSRWGILAFAYRCEVLVSKCEKVSVSTALRCGIFSSHVSTGRQEGKLQTSHDHFDPRRQARSTHPSPSQHTTIQSRKQHTKHTTNIFLFFPPKHTITLRYTNTARSN